MSNETHTVCGRCGVWREITKYSLTEQAKLEGDSGDVIKCKYCISDEKMRLKILAKSFDGVEPAEYTNIIACDLSLNWLPCLFISASSNDEYRVYVYILHQDIIIKSENMEKYDDNKQWKPHGKAIQIIRYTEVPDDHEKDKIDDQSDKQQKEKEKHKLPDLTEEEIAKRLQAMANSSGMTIHQLLAMMTGKSDENHG